MRPLHIRETIRDLIRLNATPHGIALGVAIGVFIGITPLYGFHTLMVVLAAIFVPRTNKVAMLAGTNISIPPTMPFITWGGYEIGRLIFPGRYPALAQEVFSGMTLAKAKEFYYPLLIGSLVLGLVCAVIFYFVTHHFVRAYRQKG